MSILFTTYLNIVFTIGMLKSVEICVGRVEGRDVGRGEVSREGMGEWKGYVVKREQMKRDMKGDRGERRGEG